MIRGRHAKSRSFLYLNKRSSCKKDCIPTINIFNYTQPNDIRYVNVFLKKVGGQIRDIDECGKSVFFTIEGKGYYHLSPGFSLVHDEVNDRYRVVNTDDVNFFINKQGV